MSYGSRSKDRMQRGLLLARAGVGMLGGVNTSKEGIVPYRKA